MTLVEVCVDDAWGLEAAIAGGADRIELCSTLELGGLTPSPGLIALARTAPIPVRAMVRPRAGDFVFSPTDVSTMHADIDAIRAMGIGGVVLGASLPDGRLDLAVLRELTEAAAGLDKTLHRAIDLVPDLAEAIEQAVDLGFDTILTSGRALSALEGMEDIKLAHRLAGSRLTIMAGAGVNPESAAKLMSHVSLSALHGSCSEPLAAPPNAPAARLGFSSPGRRTTSAARVAALKQVLAEASST